MAAAKKTTTKRARSRKDAKAQAPHKALKQETQEAARVAAHAAKAQPAADQTLAQAVQAAQVQLDTYADELLEEYGVPKGHLDVHIVENTTVAQHWANRRRNLTLATTLIELTALLRKGKDSMLTSCLWLWGKGLAQGPKDQRNLESKAKQAEALAKLLEKHGNDAGAAKQRERAAALRRGERPTVETTTSGGKPGAPRAAGKPSAAGRFRELILQATLTDDAIFKTVAQEFGLGPEKRAYVQWYRNDLKKRGQLTQAAAAPVTVPPPATVPPTEQCGILVDERTSTSCTQAKGHPGKHDPKPQAAAVKLKKAPKPDAKKLGGTLKAEAAADQVAAQAAPQAKPAKAKAAPKKKAAKKAAKR